MFDTMHDAAVAHDAAVIERGGPRSVLNYPTMTVEDLRLAMTLIEEKKNRVSKEKKEKPLHIEMAALTRMPTLHT